MNIVALLKGKTIKLSVNIPVVLLSWANGTCFDATLKNSGAVVLSSAYPAKIYDEKGKLILSNVWSIREFTLISGHIEFEVLGNIVQFKIE